MWRERLKVYQLVVNGYNIYCQTARGGIDKVPSWESWESFGRDRGRRSSLQLSEGCGGMLVFTEGRPKNLYRWKQWAELYCGQRDGGNRREMSHKLTKQEWPLSQRCLLGNCSAKTARGQEPFARRHRTCLTIDGHVVTFPNLLRICGHKGDYL